MAEALSVIPTVFTWPIKKFTTSNKGMPRKPGNEVTLLFRTIYFAGGELKMLFFIFEKRSIQLFWINLFCRIHSSCQFLLIFSCIFTVVSEIGSENTAAVKFTAGNKVQVIGLRGIQHGVNCFNGRAAYRAGRNAPVQVCIVWRNCF